jgi:PAS domain S-box-containing protein
MSEAADQSLHRLVLESLPIGVCVVNRQGKIILWSAGAERITGYLRQDVLGRLCEDEFLEHSDSENNALIDNSVPLLETLREVRAITGEVSLPTKSGQFLPVQLRTVPLRDDHGSVQGAVEVLKKCLRPRIESAGKANWLVMGCIDGLTALLNHSMIQAHLRESLNLYLVNMRELKEQLQKSIREIPRFDKLQNHIDMTVTNEGLRIELTESALGTFFDSGSTKMSQDGSALVTLLADELGKLPNHIAIEGHNGFETISACGDVHKLGAFCRSHQRRAAPDADEWNPGRPDHKGPRLCGPEVAQAGCSARSREPANFSHRAIYREADGRAGSIDSGGRIAVHR